MGICVANFYFKEGLPKVTEIQEKFYALTGLRVYLNVGLNLVDFPISEREVVHKLHRDFEEWEKSFDPPSDFKNQQQKRAKLNSMEGIFFSCYDFGTIGVEYQTKHNITFEYGINESGSYFSESLIKTMHELGGRDFVDSNMWQEEHIEEHHLEPYLPHEKRWKKLKKWEEYSSLMKK